MATIKMLDAVWQRVNLTNQNYWLVLFTIAYRSGAVRVVERSYAANISEHDNYVYGSMMASGALIYGRQTDLQFKRIETWTVV